MENNIRKIRRTAVLVSVLSKYGFESLVTTTRIKKFIPEKFIQKNEKRKEVFSLTIYERIRMTLEELGPTYIKLGQLMSYRDDLLPKELTTEFQKLQDKVLPEEMDPVQVLLDELGIVAETGFEYIDSKPVAAASLSQVYMAKLKSGEEVVLKMKRKGIHETVASDLLIMKDFAQLLETYYESAQKIGLTRIVSAFEKSILSELSFIQEFSNIELFARNFHDDESIYVPKVYKEFSNNNILCMEYIDGIKISDREAIITNNFNPDEIASLVVDLYMKQVIDHGFFHADPHSGNIFLLKTGRIVFIDYGSMGKMLVKDREYLGDFVICAIRKEPKGLIRVIKKMAIQYTIPEEKQLERDIYELLDTIDSSSIDNIELGAFLRKLTNVLNKNEIILPDFIYLLLRGIILLEGIGREISPEINIIESVKPYGMKLIKERLSPNYMVNKGLDALSRLNEKLDEFPDDLHLLLHKINNGELKITYLLKDRKDMVRSVNYLALSIIILALIIGSSLLMMTDIPHKLFDIPILSIAGFLFSGILIAGILFSLLKNRLTKS